jgi:nitrite reductase (NO-forming)
VQSEFYISEGEGGIWKGDLARAQAVQPDFVVFNGAADQYQQETLKAAPGELIRLHVMNAGPTLFSAFHVIGAIFDRVYVEGNPANVLRGMQTHTIPPGGGATFELTIPEPGLYPFVTHSFAYTGLGAVGLIEVA